MLKRVRQLHISLAAKCQIVFGAAVVLIISAALFVPWQRMEQLTEQLNERAAAAVARTVLADHVLRMRAASATTMPTTTTAQPAEWRASIATTRPALTIDGQPVLPPRMIAVTAATEHPDKLTRFEYSAMQRFIKDRRMPFFARFYETKEGAEGGYRYAQPLLANSECMECHSPEARSGTTTSTALTSAFDDPDFETAPGRKAEPVAAAPTTQPAPLLGLVSIDMPSQVSARQQLLNRVFILTAGLIAGVVAIVIFWLVTLRLILQPVRVLQETAEKVSEGDLNIRSDISSGDEFQVLSETFNTMLANLKNSADQLRAVNKSLDLKLGQLAESNVALYESNRLKSEFLANVSHELRTPLNSILGFAELLKDLTLPAGDPKIARYIQNIYTAGHNLLDLINDLLDLAKIEAGRMEVRSEPLSLTDLFEALASVLKPLTEQKNLTIVPAVSSDFPIIETDPAKLQQILYNFLSNAIKFSPVGEKIELSAQLEADRIRISVTDHGPGIDTAKHNMIFEKFRQLDGSVTREHSGTGLGLAISKELTTLLGGTIGLSSELGQGATFYIILPMRIASAAADVRSRLVLT
jgi:two-component system sensor histidine kinase BarA